MEPPSGPSADLKIVGDGKRFCEVRAARNVSWLVAPRLVVIEGESEGERVAGFSLHRAVGG